MTKKTLLSILLFFQLHFILGNPTSDFDTSIQIVPHWKSGESHTISILSSTEQSLKKSSIKSATSFKVRFSILEKSDSSYKVGWEYLKSDLDSLELNPENLVFNYLIGVKMICTLSSSGHFTEVLNTSQIKTILNGKIEGLIGDGKSDKSMSTTIDIIKQILVSDDAFKFSICKHIVFYTGLYGNEYSSDSTQLQTVTVPNFLGGEPYKTTRKRKIIELDTKHNTCSIMSETSVKANELKEDIINFLKKDENNDKESLDIIAKYDLEFSETAIRKINYISGINLKSSYTRKMIFGFDNSVVVWQFETLD